MIVLPDIFPPTTLFSSAIFNNISKFFDKFAIFNMEISRVEIILESFYLAKISRLNLDKLTVLLPTSPNSLFSAIFVDASKFFNKFVGLILSIVVSGPAISLEPSIQTKSLLPWFFLFF